MAVGTALKKIHARVKHLRKLHPGKAYKTLQKQAGKEFKAGSLSVKKKRKSAKRKIGKVKTSEKKKGGESSRTFTATPAFGFYRVNRAEKNKRGISKIAGTRRRKRKVKAVTRRRRVSGTGGMDMLTMGLLAGGALLVLSHLNKPQIPVLPQLSSN